MTRLKLLQRKKQLLVTLWKSRSSSLRSAINLILSELVIIFLAKYIIEFLLDFATIVRVFFSIFYLSNATRNCPSFISSFLLLLAFDVSCASGVVVFSS